MAQPYESLNDVHIAFSAIPSSYLEKHVSPTLLSVAKNTKAKVVCHLITDKETQKLNRIRQCFMSRFSNLEILIDEIPSELLNLLEKNIPIRDDDYLNKRLGIGTYIHLLIPRMIETEKVISLSCDQIILGDISELYSTDIQEQYLGVCLENKNNNSITWSGFSPKTYYNAGVLLWNVEKFRTKPDYLNEIFDLLKHYRPLCADQDILNMLYKGQNIQILDKSWNTFPVDMSFKNLWIKQPKIIHFIGDGKPWSEYFSVMLNRGFRSIIWAILNDIKGKNSLFQCMLKYNHYLVKAESIIKSC